MGKKRSNRKRENANLRTRAEKARSERALTLTWLWAPRVVDLGGLHLVDDLHEAGAVGEVTVVQLHVCRIEAHTVTGRERTVHSENLKPRLVLGWQPVTVIWKDLKQQRLTLAATSIKDL